MRNTNSPFRRVIITGALVGALSLSSLAVVAAQDGVTPADVTEAEAEVAPGFLGVRISTEDAGVVVSAVLSGSPAEDAGIEVGDLITAVNGDVVTEAADVAAAISALAAGDTVELTLTRGEETLTVSAVLGEAMNIEAATVPSFEPPKLRGLGLSYDTESQSWTIDELTEDSALYAAGLRAGDQITAIDGEAYGPLELMGHLTEVGQDADLTLTVQRDGETLDLTVPAADLLLGGLMGHGMLQGMMPFGQMLPDGAMPNLGQAFGLVHPNLGGWLGLSFITLDEQVAAENGVDLTDGALVREVAADSPAATAGLAVDDIITAVNGEPVDQERTLRDRLSAYEAGDVVTLTVVRAGEELQIEVTLAEPAPLMMGQMMIPFGDMQMMPGFRGHGQQGFEFRGWRGNNGPQVLPAPDASGANA